MRQYIFLFFVFFLTGAFSQTEHHPLITEDAKTQKHWVDSLYNGMTLKEKIAQLYMVQVYSSQTTKEKNAVIDLIKTHKIGGVIYSKGGPVRQAKLNNELQKMSNVPLLIGMDAEWGLSMRLDSTYSFPWNMTLGGAF